MFRHKKQTIFAKAHTNEWIVHGNFNKLYNHGQFDLFQRQIFYTRKRETPGEISEIMINGYKTGDTQIAVSFRDTQSKSKYRKHISNSGIVTKESVSGDNDYYYWLNITNKEHLSKILDSLCQLDPAVRQIQDDIVTQVSPHMRNLPTINGWVMHGNLSYPTYTLSGSYDEFQQHSHLAVACYQESYENCSQQPIVMKFDFLADEELRCKARITFDQNYYADYESLKKDFIRNNLEIVHGIGFNGKHSYSFDIAIKNKKELQTLLKVLISIDSAVTEKLTAYITSRYVAAIENKDTLIEKPVVDIKEIDCQRKFRA